MPVSDRKLAANRANALKSTGPKTPAGKKTCSQNALKHGMLAKAVIIDGESTERFLELVESFHAEYDPQTPSACSLIESLAIAEWFRLRGWTLHSTAINHEMRRQADAHPEYDAPARAMHAMRVLSENSRHTELMSRCQHRYDTQYHRALQALERMKQEKLARAKQTHHFEENIDSDALPEATDNPPESHQNPVSAPANPPEPNSGDREPNC